MTRNLKFKIAICAFVVAMFATEAMARRPAGASRIDAQTRSANQAEPIAGVAEERQSEFDSVTRVCRTSTLGGTYLYRESGYLAGEPYRSSGLETYDSRGGIVGRATDSDTGESYQFIGTYELDGDCHGRVRYDGDFYYDIYVSPDGESIEFISTDLGAVLSGPSQRVTHQFIIR